MHVRDLQYDLPPELIAQEPAARRDASRLLVVDRQTGELHHSTFARVTEWLEPGSLMVMNNTRVLPARLHMHRRSGGRVEGLFLLDQKGTWDVMLTGAGRLKPGEELTINGSERTLRLIERGEAGVWRTQPLPGGDAVAILNECGHPPLPPYIRRDEPGRPADADSAEHPGAGATAQESVDLDRYQTIYAQVPGAVAAPTAGLHFTPDVFAELAKRQIERTYVTLHVGVGTFAPIRVDDLAAHPMHAEHYECTPETATAVDTARRAGRPVVAVGTTSVRVLETCAAQTGEVQPGSGWTRIFIYPPYRLRAVDRLLTNFHLPGSTLLALVFAFAGRELMLKAYDEAIRMKYRFYSYGDAMLIR